MVSGLGDGISDTDTDTSGQARPGQARQGKGMMDEGCLASKALLCSYWLLTYLYHHE